MSTATVDLSKMNTQELLAYIAKQDAENKRLAAEKAEAEKRAAEQGSYSVKIGRSGTVSVSGFGRYGISLYPSQWHSLAPLMPGILAFIKANEDGLKERVEHPIPDGEPNPSKGFKLVPVKA